MTAQAVVGPDRGSTSIKRLRATVDGPEGRIERRLDECVKATTGRAWFSSEGA
jgi:hypothetical protein